MRRHLKYLGMTLSLLAVLWLGSCQKDDNDDGGSGKGYLSLSFTKDLNVAVTKAGEIYRIEIVDLFLGETVESFPNHTQIPSKIELRTGDYLVKAYTGDDLAAGFDKPLYGGSVKAGVRKDQTTTANITCTLVSTKVSVAFSNELLAEMTACNVTVRNEDVQDEGLLTFAQSETRDGYFRCTGNLTWRINLKNKNGTEFTLIHTIKNVKSREHYILNFGIDKIGNGGSSSAEIDIELDEQLKQQKHNIDLILGKKPVAAITGVDFDINEETEIESGNTIPYVVNIKAPGRIYRMTVNHNSSSIEANGVPRSFSPIKSPAAVLAAVNAAGINWDAAVDEAGEVNVDFTTLISSLEIGKYEFELDILDFQNQNVKQKLAFEIGLFGEVRTLSANPWAKFAVLTAKWNTAERPDGIGFVYHKDTETEWLPVEGAITVSGNNFSATVKNLEPETEYIFKAVTSAHQNALEIPFTTEGTAQIPNMNFDDWFKDGNAWYANLNLAAGNFWWDSGNKGANTLGEVNPTKPEETIVVSGKAARLGSTTAALGIFAAGNIYTGQFQGATLSPMGAKLDFGRPYTARPTGMKGYYQYKPGIINKTGGDYGSLNGTQDSCAVYAILTDWDTPFRISTGDAIFIDIKNDPGIIAYGEMKESKTMTAYEPFEFKLNYRDTTRKPKYVVIVASASKYGDYFTGSTSSVMYIDEFEFTFDPE